MYIARCILNSIQVYDRSKGVFVSPLMFQTNVVYNENDFGGDFNQDWKHPVIMYGVKNKFSHFDNSGARTSFP